jgi:hypothetical protein
MNTHKVVTVLLGFIAALAVPTGYWLGSRNTQLVVENMSFVLRSERNVETVQNLKALDGLKDNRVDETVRFMQLRVANALKYEGIEASTVARAQDYQRKHCENACLGIR